MEFVDSAVEPSTTGSGLATSAWDLDDEAGRADIHEETFGKTMRDAMHKMLKEFGGPENYLRARFAEQQELIEWLNYLVHMVPVDCSPFDFSENLPPTTVDTLEQASVKLLAGVRPQPKNMFNLLNLTV